MDCRTTESCNFKRKLGFNLHDVINYKQKTVVGAIKDTSEGKNIKTECSVIGYRVDLYLYDINLAIKVDEFGYSDRNTNYEIQRQK